MSFFGYYKVICQNGKKRFMTAKQLYDRVIENSETEYKWIVPASELVRICEKPGFPEKYAREIKIHILRSFTGVEAKKEYSKSYLEKEINAVRHCYNSMKEFKDEDVISARRKYFSTILDGIIKNNVSNRIRISINIDSSYKKVCKEWKESMIETYFPDTTMDYDKLKRMLNIEFFNTLNLAKNQGIITRKSKEKRKNETINDNTLHERACNTEEFEL